MTRKLVDLRQQIAEPLDPLPALPSAVRVEAPLNPHVQAIVRRLSQAQHQRLLTQARREETTVFAIVERRLDYLKGLYAAVRP